jgi:hypothetical protein
MRCKTAVRRLTEVTAWKGILGRAFPQVTLVWWAWLDLNLGPHPYQVSRAKGSPLGNLAGRT